MIFLGVLLGLGIMAGTAYMALDKKSDFKTRVASLIALAVMVVTVIICFFLVFTDTSVPVDESVLIVGAPPEVKETGGNTMVLLLMIIFLIALFAVIAFLSVKEHRKMAPKKTDTVPGASKNNFGNDDFEF